MHRCACECVRYAAVSVWVDEEKSYTVCVLDKWLPLYDNVVIIYGAEWLSAVAFNKMVWSDEWRTAAEFYSVWHIDTVANVTQFVREAWVEFFF